MTDQFARQTAQHAHHRIAELAAHIGRLETSLARRRAFRHRCYLCGEPIKKGSAYCHAHSWAEGKD